ncbi:transglycosylase domain-containing protein [Pseudonocardia xinjiangensis]|uniref:transglycosylase domain-containing protein n=1 Tax=Pseudonocardia xinjiangensis TaxID=75289 RepID=UPI003D8A5AA7
MLGVVAAVVLAVMSFPVVGGIGLLAAQVSSGSVNVAPAALLAGNTPDVTTVTDSTGKPIAYLYDQFRLPATSAQISPAMKAAIVAIEDRRFFEHGGVDPVGTVRALVNDAGGGAQQGGSTLTQQYVKNYELYVAATTDAQRQAAIAPSLARKIHEAELAVQLDNELSKDEILTRYLDIVYFGHGAYGVAAAAQVYFGTTAAQLTIPEAALLAGMVQSPTQYDPVQHPDAATARRNVVIQQMHQLGSINDADAAAATASPLGVSPTADVPDEGCTAAGDAGYFCAYVVRYLKQAGFTSEQLASGGYTVRTTLDPDALAKAKAAVDSQVPPTTPHVADVLSFVQPGQTQHRITAMVANRTYGNGPGQSSYGLPFQPENLGAGSVYKIFTAATAMEQGLIGIDSVIDVPPSGYVSPIYKDGSGHAIPVHNAEETLAPQLTLTKALAESPNTAFVKLEESTGIAPIVDMALRLGMTSLNDPVSDQPGALSIADTVKAEKQASFTLGVTPTSDLELANVDATLQSHGMWCPPTPIDSVTDENGNPVPIKEQACNQAVAPALADTLANGLSQDDGPGGTSAAAASAEDWHRPTSAKTGTTQIFQSAAFVGATPQLAGAAIVFDDSRNPRPICDGSPPSTCSSGTLFGGGAPARTFYKAANDILAGTPVVPLAAPAPEYLRGRDS